MLDAETRRRIDTARDILVGKVPDPKSQVEQITIALIYKFMDDMDAVSEEMGGKRKFFVGDFARYGWSKLMRSGLSGHETLNLYAEAITRMTENPGIPPLFRTIFNNAYLPYRDPETLRAFLKIIDEFTYDNSENLGDAYEYLLSVLGTQGKLGQFRTPRHIIDFIVAVVDPQKDETVLDPACGTAGFLIAAYKHILCANSSDDGSTTLTPDEKGRFAYNFKGYDIDPGMVRFSLVNMYLHQFANPKVYEYDTLTSEDRWNEYADVILANPPFMSPKGGIRPHNRFSVQSKRSEVLFVDYMAEHLTANGRAGFIVPEGIIFQSQNAYKKLRKMLVEEYLVAVVSLPAGVFNPYSGVKTSILFLDRALAKQNDRIAFFKVKNDGFDLGAQRQPIDKNDLPPVQAALRQYLETERQDRQYKDKSSSSLMSPHFLIPKAKVAATGDYTLSGERYRDVGNHAKPEWPVVELGELISLEYGKSLKSENRIEGPFPVYGSNGIVGYHNQYLIEGPTIIVGRKGSAGAVKFSELPCFPIDTTFFVQIKEQQRLDIRFCYYQLLTLELGKVNVQSGVPGLNRNDAYRKQIPLPPLEVQQEIVAEIEGYQEVIDGARAVIDNYRPHIPINSDWPTIKVGDAGLFQIESGGTPNSSTEHYWDGGVPWITLVDLPPENFVTEIKNTVRTISEAGLRHSSARLLPENSVVVSSRATIGRVGINRIPLATNQGFKNVVIKDSSRAIPEYVALALTKLVPRMQALAGGATYKEISKSTFCELKIPLPPIETQQAIVAEIEAEQSLVAANRELIERMEGKIQQTIERVWEQRS